MFLVGVKEGGVDELCADGGARVDGGKFLRGEILHQDVVTERVTILWPAVG